MKKVEATHWYMDVTVQSEEGRDEMSAEMLQVIMRDAVLEVFGESVASLPLDVLIFEPRLGRAVIRVPSLNYCRVRAALSLYCSKAGVSFGVSNASPCLIALAGPCRTLT